VKVVNKIAATTIKRIVAIKRSGLPPAEKNRQISEVRRVGWETVNLVKILSD